MQREQGRQTLCARPALPESLQLSLEQTANRTASTHASLESMEQLVTAKIVPLASTKLSTEKQTARRVLVESTLALVLLSAHFVLKENL